MVQAATLRVRIQTGCVVEGETCEAGDELEVSVGVAKKLVGWKLGVVLDGDLETAGPMVADETVASRRKRTRG